MTKLKPDRFDEFMDDDFTWENNCAQPDDCQHKKFICKHGNYYLYHAWDSDKEKGGIYRNKIRKEKKVCSKCGQEIKDE